MCISKLSFDWISENSGVTCMFPFKGIDPISVKQYCTWSTSLIVLAYPDVSF